MNEKIKQLKKDIPNILDFYTEEEIESVVEKLGENEIITDTFVDAEWDRPIRRCSHCGKLMVDGYLLGGEYACSDDCRNEIYKEDCGAENDEDAERMYLIDCLQLDEEETDGLSAAEIEEKFGDRDVSDDVMWTSWE